MSARTLDKRLQIVDGINKCLQYNSTKIIFNIWSKIQSCMTSVPLLCVCVCVGPVFSGAVAALVIVSGILVISLLFLYHTGFLCKVTTLPRALIVSYLI